MLHHHLQEQLQALKLTPHHPPDAQQWLQFLHQLSQLHTELEQQRPSTIELSQDADELAALYRASVQLFRASNLRDSAQQICSNLTQEFDFADCTVLLREEFLPSPRYLGKTQTAVPGQLIRMAQAGKYQHSVASALKLDGPGLIPAAIRTGQTLHVPDVTADPRYLVGDSQTRSELVVPLRVGEQIIGALDLQSPIRDAFDERDRRVINVFAEHAALSLENARLYEELRHYTQELEQRIADQKQYEIALHEAKEAAEAAARVKSQFLTNMSHEIRTPLNAIIGMTGLLLDTTLSDEQYDFVETVRTSSDTLLAVINDILDFSKIEAGQLKMENQPFSLRACIEDSLDLLAPRAKEKGLDLAYILAEEIPDTIIGDVTRLRQVLANLIDNAVKFTETGEVVVTGNGRALHQGRWELHLTVRDTGIGIPPDRMNHLFHAFSQVDASMTRQYGGTGLGLIISKHFIEMMSGKIWAESEMGQGSYFHFTIQVDTAAAPLHVQDGQELTETQPAPTPFSTRLGEKNPLRILIAEDNAINQKVALRILERLGYRADVAGNGLETIAALQRQPYDLILMDVQMPEMDGVAATHHIRRHFPPAQQPWIVAMTAHALPGDRETYLAGGMDDYISKPVRIDNLVSVLAKCQPMNASLAAGSAPSRLKQMTATWPVDMLRLQAMIGADAELQIQELLPLFFEDTHNLLQRMETAVANNDETTFLQAIHAFKGNCASLSFTSLTQLSQRIETITRQYGLDAARTDMQQLNVEYDYIRDVLMPGVGRRASVDSLEMGMASRGPGTAKANG